MLPYWKESPFVRILLPFIAGIFTYTQFPDLSLYAVGIMASVVLLAIIAFRYVADPLKFQYALLPGMLLHLLLLACGYFTCKIHEPGCSAIWYRHHKKVPDHLLIRLSSPPEQREKTDKAEAEIIAVYTRQEYARANGKVILYFQHSEKNKTINEGDHLLISNKLNDIRHSGNPGSFDYARYCANRGIFQTAYLKANEWIKTTQHSEDFASFFSKLNASTRAILKKYIPDSAAHGVAEALLLGYRGDIDENTWQAYSNTGIVHIIAISGMHMAMVYGSTRWLLLLIPFFKKRKRSALVMALMLMWAFACLTGLPASVARAAIMFTFIAWGEMQNRQTHSLNMLAASAFFMLSFNPSYLQDVGLQLSYLAVCSLIMFYLPIFRLWMPQNTIAENVWKLCAMTIAAQVLTLPLCLFYFHQFPLLFMLTNLFAVPLTSFILYLEILLVFVSSLTPVATVAGVVIARLIIFVNSSIATLAKLSFAVWSDIQISVFQLILLFCFIAFVSLFLWRKNFQWLCISLSILLIFCSTLLYRQWEIFHQHKIIVYHTAGRQHIEFIEQNHFYSPDHDSLQKETRNEKYVFHPAHTFFSVAEAAQSPIALRQKNGVALCCFNNKKVIRIENNRFEMSTPIETDLLIISKKCVIDTVWLNRNIRPHQIVLDASVPVWTLQDKRSQLANTGIPIHCVAEDGAFIWDID